MPTPALPQYLWRNNDVPPPTPGPPSGSIFWYKADEQVYQDTSATTPANHDGDPVALAVDRGSGGPNAEQASSGLRCTLHSPVQNGLPMIGANGSNQFLSLGASLGTPANWTVLAVLKMPATLAGTIPFGGINIGTYPKGTWALVEVAWPAAPGSISVQWADNLLLSRWITDSPDISADEVMLLRIQYNDGDTVCTIAKNGSVLAAHSNLNAAAHSSGVPSSFSLFRSGDYSGEYFAGMIGEILGYDRSLSAGDITQAEGYLLDRWGL